MKEFFAGGAVGILLWEAAKLIGSAFLKRRGDSGADKRKVLRDDLSRASELAEECLTHAVDYYTCQDAQGRAEHAKTLRHAMQLLGICTNQVNVGAQATGRQGIASGKLVAFRKAATKDLDSATFVPVTHEHASVSAIYRTAHELQLSLTESLYRAT